MTLRKKTIFMILISFSCLVFTLYLASHWIVMRSFDQIEKKITCKDTNRLLLAIDARMDWVQRILKDWSRWDKTSAFMDGKNPAFIPSYFKEDKLEKHGLSLLVFAKPDGRVHYGTMFDLNHGQMVPLSKDIEHYLKPSSPLLGLQPVQSYLLLDGNLMLVASRPIVATNGSGSTCGTIIAGFRMDQSFFHELGRQTRNSVFLTTASRAVTLAATRRKMCEGDGASTITVQAIDRELIAGSVCLRDVYGQGVAELSVRQSRTVHEAAYELLFFFILLVLVSGLVLSLAMAYMLKKIFLNRLERLNYELHRVGLRGDLHARVEMACGDEFGELAEGINTMLDSLMQTDEAVQLAQEELRRINDNLEAHVSARTVELARANVKLTHEIAERERIEEALYEASRRKDEFLAMLAHELRNPLAPIRNAVQVLHMAGNDDRVKWRQWEIIERQVSHMARLLDDLLDVSRITQRKIRLLKDDLDLRLVIDRALESVQCEIHDHGHSLLYRRPGVPIWVHGDPTRLEQVLVNLLHNAVKYTEGRGSIQISVAGEAGAEPSASSNVVLRVKDTGIGIAPDVLPYIFGLFVQGDRSLDRTQGGLGIGLTLVDRLIQMHGGSVQAFSEGLGKGSEFVVRLPLLAHGPAGADAAAAGEQLVLEFEQPAEAEGNACRKVLVVDDNADMARSMGELLELWGYQVRVAFDGSSAIEEATAFLPEIVLLDIGLPGMNGYEVARCLRQASAFDATLLVALTGYSQEEDRQQALAAGFDRFCTKPVDLHELRLILDGAKDQEMEFMNED